MTTNNIKKNLAKCAALVAALVLLCVVLQAAPAEAKVYIDITSPRQQVLLAVSRLAGSFGQEIADIVRDDLEFTGFFVPLGSEAFLEKPTEAFDAANWSPLGAELVIKGYIRRSGEDISAIVTLYDVRAGRRVFKKLYKASRSLLRPLAHSIANDVYKKVTGQDGVFRTKIAFIRKLPGHHELYLMDWDGQRLKKLGIRSDALMAVHWSRDAKKLIYSAQRKRMWGIYIFKLKSGEESLAFRVRGTNIAGDFFPGGREFLLSSSKAGTPDIYRYNIRRSRLTRIVGLKGIEVSPTLSPDGNRIAFVSDRGGSPQIYYTDKIGYTMARITYEGSYNTSPAWSPKGDRLAFSGRHKGKNHIFTVKSDGTGLQMLTGKGNNENPSFSPDGRFIVFSSDRDGKKGVYIMRANGEAQKKITPWNMDAFAPGWSPK